MTIEEDVEVVRELWGIYSTDHATLTDQKVFSAALDRIVVYVEEKEQELAVAYGSGRSELEQRWFSALDRAKFENDVLRKERDEMRKVLQEIANNADYAELETVVRLVHRQQLARAVLQRIEGDGS